MAGGIPSPPPGKDEFDSCKDMFELKSWMQSSRNVIKRKRYRFPNRLSPTRFVRRGLTIEEGLSLFDIPATLTVKMSKELRKLLLPNIDAPLKVISPVAQCVGKWVSRNMGVGGVYFRAPPRKREERKEDHQDTPSWEAKRRKKEHQDTREVSGKSLDEKFRKLLDGK
jgi:hypothetical protein